ncbi:EAL domain-containing protein [Salinivibrio sharmensis]|uniref:EAL domain-containing protein n=1 Tax=Salinivibrio sharmensis TaxID=390883 RepID=A0ABX3KG36_9GAMM|nr:EAL domain-containing protein [Salinivibrio sharmensis]OOE88068.1 hypothetical protein BZG74_10350 [Salinivibrio sharmensis]
MTRKPFVTLHSKAALIFILGLLAIFISSLLVTRYFFLFGISHLEDIEIARSNDQAQAIIERLINNQAEYAIDWAHWDDTYELVNGRNPDFAARNLEDASLESLGLNLMGFADLNGKVIEAKVLNEKDEHAFISDIYQSAPVHDHITQRWSNQRQSLAGLLELRGRIWVISVSPIRDSSGQAEAAGWMIWGQALTGRFPSAYENILAGKNTLVTATSIYANSELPSIARDNTYITRLSPLHDLNGDLVAILKTKEPRRYYQQGKQVFYYLILALVIISALIGGSVYLLYRRKVTKPFISFERDVSALLGDAASPTKSKDTFTRITQQIEALAQSSSQTEQQLKEALSKFDALYHSQHLGMIVLEGEKIVDVNQALLQLLGHQRNTLLHRSFATLVINDESALKQLMQFEQHPERETTHFETTLQSAAGQPLNCAIEVIRLDRQESGAVMLAVKDMSQQKRQAALIETLSQHDTLSGLLNRPATIKALNEALSGPSPVSTIYFIATRLREIYEIYGHAAYDGAVKHIADSLSQRFHGVTVGRLSENEFVIFSHSNDDNKLINEANDVLRDSTNHSTITDTEFDIGLKAAFVDSHLQFEHFEALVHCGFYAIEQQHGPKQHVIIVDDALAQAGQETLVINRNLVAALKNHEFTAFFQPIVNATSNQVIGFEALARWHHPALGMISPGIFIPLAEKHKLIIELDELVLEKACAFLQQIQQHWSRQSQHRLTIHINLSSPHFGAKSLVTNLKRLIQQYQLAPGQLVLEVTESILLGADQETIKRMHDLKALGVQLALDDFGTGYSSFSSLCNFPLDIVKLDKSYMSEIETNEKAKTLVRSIINMAQELGMTTVAEGVETASQLRIVNVWRVDEIQGFYFFKPMSAEQALSTFAHNK